MIFLNLCIGVEEVDYCSITNVTFILPAANGKKLSWDTNSTQYIHLSGMCNCTLVPIILAHISDDTVF